MIVQLCNEKRHAYQSTASPSDMFLQSINRSITLGITGGARNTIPSRPHEFIPVYALVNTYSLAFCVCGLVCLIFFLCFRFSFVFNSMALVCFYCLRSTWDHPQFFSGVCVVQSLVFWVVSCVLLFVFLSFSF